MSKIYKSIKVNNEDKKIITHTFIDKYENEYDTEGNNENFISDENFDNNEENIENESQWVLEGKQEASRIMQQANKQADELIKTETQKINEWWEQKRAEDITIVEKKEREGYDKGYFAGKVKAEEDIMQIYQSTIDQAQNILKESYKLKEEIIQESELPIIELSVSIAEKIIKKEIETDQDIIKLIVNDALKNINEFEKISIYIKPDNFSYLHNAREELLKGLNGQVELMIFPDSSIGDDGCIIRTTSETLDAKIDTQLEEIKKVIYEIAGRIEG